MEVKTFIRTFMVEWDIQDLINNPSKFFRLTISVVLVSTQQFFFREVKIMKTYKRFDQNKISAQDI